MHDVISVPAGPIGLIEASEGLQNLFAFDMGADDGLLFGVIRCALINKAIEDLALEHERV